MPPTLWKADLLASAAGIPAAKIYKYTMVDNKVVLVDPTRMRVADVIGPPPSH